MSPQATDSQVSTIAIDDVTEMLRRVFPASDDDLVTHALPPGEPPLTGQARLVVETVLALGSAFARLPLDATRVAVASRRSEIRGHGDRGQYNWLVIAASALSAAAQLAVASADPVVGGCALGFDDGDPLPFDDPS